MLSKKERTIEKYMEIGAQMRLCKCATAKAAEALGGVLPKNDVSKLIKAMNLLSHAASKADDRMFADHPEISDEYVRVFYGTLHGESNFEVDQKVRELAKEYAEKIFNEKFSRDDDEKLKESKQRNHSESSAKSSAVSEEEYNELLKAARKMHLWIFLNVGDEEKAYEECGLSEEMNKKLGYHAFQCLKKTGRKRRST